MSTKQKFYEEVAKKYPYSEISKILHDNPDCDFYEVCQSFLDIALNAPKIINDDNTVSGVFQYADINIAKEKSERFITEYKVKEIDSFFSILNLMYVHAEEPREKRQKGGFVIETTGFGYQGKIGTYYIFTHICDEIYEEIVNEIKAELNLSNTCYF